MIHTLWHNFRPWKVWAGGIILIGLLLIATQCTPTATSIVQETPTREPPEITGFTCIPPDTVLPGAKIGIHVKVKLHGHKIDNYRWVVEEGSIVSGQGESAITYQAPETPGSYKVCVKLECEGSSVEYSEMVEVVPKPTPTEEPTVEPTEQPTEEPTEEPTAEPTEQPTEEPTEEPTAEPTVEPTEEPTPKPDDAVVKVEALNLRSGPGTAYYSIRVLKQSSTLKVTGKNLDGDWLKVIAPGGEEGWVAASCLEINVPLAGLAVAQAPPAPTPIPAPAPIATPTPTETPAPLPAPQLLEPKDAARFVGVVHLTWEWKVRPLAEDEYFSVRIRPERARSEDPIPTPCWHSAVKDFHYHGNISDYCTNNKHYWSVIVAREAPESPTGWEEISVISEERWFDFFECFEEEDPGVCPRC